MSAWLSKATTLSLAVFYALLVSCGHALHFHGECDVACEATTHACPCGHHHEPAEPSSDSSDASGWRVASDNNGCEDCAACQLMSHMKFGHHAAKLLAVASTVACAEITDYQAPFCSPVHEAWTPRGPPLGLSA